MQDTDKRRLRVPAGNTATGWLKLLALMPSLPTRYQESSSICS